MRSSSSSDIFTASHSILLTSVNKQEDQTQTENTDRDRQRGMYIDIESRPSEQEALALLCLRRRLSIFSVFSERNIDKSVVLDTKQGENNKSRETRRKYLFTRGLIAFWFLGKKSEGKREGLEKEKKIKQIIL